MKHSQPGTTFGACLAIGSVLGVLTDNLAIGIALGVVVGLAGEVWSWRGDKPPTDPPHDSSPPEHDTEPPEPGR